MTYNGLLDRYTLDLNKAYAYGFRREKDALLCRKPFGSDGFEAEFIVSGKEFRVEVYDETGELYLPFNVKEPVGGFTASVREEVKELIYEMLDVCFVSGDPKTRLLDYVRKKYGTEAEAPWEDLEGYNTLKTAKKKKWYGLFMRIPYQYLGVSKEGKTDVLNVKVKPGAIPGLIDGIHYFPSYHMNKKYWITILLDKGADLEKAERLLDESYAIVEGVRTGGKRQWLVPTNPKYFDLEQAFAENDTILWKQSSSISAGDIVCLYVAAPFSAILYRCEAVETDIPYHYDSGKVRMSYVMKIKLLNRFGPDQYPFKKLKEMYGIRAVRGPRYMPESLRRDMEKSCGKN